jgi:hypothetical protein
MYVPGYLPMLGRDLLGYITAAPRLGRLAMGLGDDRLRDSPRHRPW